MAKANPREVMLCTPDSSMMVVEGRTREKTSVVVKGGVVCQYPLYAVSYINNTAVHFYKSRHVTI